MLYEIFRNILISSVIGSVFILLIVLLSNIIDKKYKIKWRYYIWIVLAIYLLIPFDLSIEKPLVNVNMSEIIVREINNRNEKPINTEIVNNEIILNQDIKEENIIVDTENNSKYNVVQEETQNINKLNIKDIIIGIWLIGIALFTIYHIYIYRKFRKNILVANTEVLDNEIIDIFNSLKEEYNIKNNIDIKINNSIKSPVVLGLFKKELLLPNINLDINKYNMIIRHELIHIKRNDILYKFIIILSRGVHWFNPFVHLMGKKANEDIEITCDLEVVEKMSEEYKKDYSNTILDIAGNDIEDYIFTTNFSGGKSTLKNRFENILSGVKKKSRFIGIFIISIILSITFLVSCSGEREKYLFEDLGIEIILKGDNIGKYDLRNIKNGVNVHRTTNNNYNDFRIYKVIGTDISNESTDNFLNPTKIIGQKNGYTYLLEYNEKTYKNIIRFNEELNIEMDELVDSIKIKNIDSPIIKNQGYKIYGDEYFNLEIPKSWEIIKDEKYKWKVLEDNIEIGDIELTNLITEEERLEANHGEKLILKDNDSYSVVSFLSMNPYRKAIVNIKTNEDIEKILDTLEFTKDKMIIGFIERDGRGEEATKYSILKGKIKDIEFLDKSVVVFNIIDIDSQDREHTISRNVDKDFEGFYTLNGLNSIKEDYILNEDIINNHPEILDREYNIYTDLMEGRIYRLEYVNREKVLHLRDLKETFEMIFYNDGMAINPILKGSIEPDFFETINKKINPYKDLDYYKINSITKNNNKLNIKASKNSGKEIEFLFDLEGEDKVKDSYGNEFRVIESSL